MEKRGRLGMVVVMGKSLKKEPSDEGGGKNKQLGILGGKVTMKNW